MVYYKESKILRPRIFLPIFKSREGGPGMVMSVSILQRTFWIVCRSTFSDGRGSLTKPRAQAVYCRWRGLAHPTRWKVFDNRIVQIWRNWLWWYPPSWVRWVARTQSEFPKLWIGRSSIAIGAPADTVAQWFRGEIYTQTWYSDKRHIEAKVLIQCQRTGLMPSSAGRGVLRGSSAGRMADFYACLRPNWKLLVGQKLHSRFEIQVLKANVYYKLRR